MSAAATEAHVDLDALPGEDLVALVALKLTVEVDADPTAAVDIARRAPPDWRRDFLRSGPGCIGADPIDARCLGRARAQQLAVERRPAPPAPPPDVRSNGAWPAPPALGPSAAVAVATFAALDAADDETDLEDELDALEIEVSSTFEADARRAPTDRRPVVPEGPPPGFLSSGAHVAGLPLEVTATQHLA